jgi:hypothetical protein
MGQAMPAMRLRPAASYLSSPVSMTCTKARSSGAEASNMGDHCHEHQLRRVPVVIMTVQVNDLARDGMCLPV